MPPHLKAGRHLGNGSIGIERRSVLETTTFLVVHSLLQCDAHSAVVRILQDESAFGLIKGSGDNFSLDEGFAVCGGRKADAAGYAGGHCDLPDVGGFFPFHMNWAAWGGDFGEE